MFNFYLDEKWFAIRIPLLIRQKSQHFHYKSRFHIISRTPNSTKHLTRSTWYYLSLSLSLFLHIESNKLYLYLLVQPFVNFTFLFTFTFNLSLAVALFVSFFNLLICFSHVSTSVLTITLLRCSGFCFVLLILSLFCNVCLQQHFLPSLTQTLPLAFSQFVVCLFVCLFVKISFCLLSTRVRLVARVHLVRFLFVCLFICMCLFCPQKVAFSLYIVIQQIQHHIHSTMDTRRWC